MQPYPFQEADLQRLAENNWTGLLNYQTGAGKTAMGCWAIQRSGARVALIVCPAQTMESAWKPTVRKILGVEAREIGNRNKATKAALSDFLWGYEGVYLVTPQLLTRADTDEWSGDMIVIDESHTVSAPGKKGQRKLGGYNRSDKNPLRESFPHRIMLSGTALRNKFDLAWGISRFLWDYLDNPGEIADKNFYRWQNDRMEYKDVYTSRRDKNGDPIVVKEYFGESEPGKWISESPMIATHFKREKCCEYHPEGFLSIDEPTVREDTLELLPAQKKAIAEMESMMMTYLDDNPMVADIPLTKAQRIRQVTLGVPTIEYDEDGEPVVTFAEDCKSPYLDRLESMLLDEYEEENVVVYTSSQKFAAVTVARLNKAGIPAFEYSGATRKTRDEMLTEFGGKYRVIVGVLAAVSEGVDGLQKVSQTEIWLDRSTDETINEQGMGRLDRIGSKGQVERILFFDDQGISEGKYSEAVEKRLAHNRSLKSA